MELQELIERIQRWKQRNAEDDGGEGLGIDKPEEAYSVEPVDVQRQDSSSEPEEEMQSFEPEPLDDEMEGQLESSSDGFAYAGDDMTIVDNAPPDATRPLPLEEEVRHGEAAAAPEDDLASQGFDMSAAEAEEEHDDDEFDTEQIDIDDPDLKMEDEI